MFILEKWIVSIFRFCLFIQKISVSFFLWSDRSSRKPWVVLTCFLGRTEEFVLAAAWITLYRALWWGDSYPGHPDSVSSCSPLLCPHLCSTECSLLGWFWGGELMNSFKRRMNDHRENLGTKLPKLERGFGAGFFPLYFIFVQDKNTT